MDVLEALLSCLLKSDSMITASPSLSNNGKPNVRTHIYSGENMNHNRKTNRFETETELEVKVMLAASADLVPTNPLELQRGQSPSDLATDNQLGLPISVVAAGETTFANATSAEGIKEQRAANAKGEQDLENRLAQTTRISNQEFQAGAKRALSENARAPVDGGPRQQISPERRQSILDNAFVKRAEFSKSKPFKGKNDGSGTFQELVADPKLNGDNLGELKINLGTPVGKETQRVAKESAKAQREASSTIDRAGMPQTENRQLGEFNEFRTPVNEDTASLIHGHPQVEIVQNANGDPLINSVRHVDDQGLGPSRETVQQELQNRAKDA